MELYTLNESLRRTEVVDLYESLIWTERWAEWGDFELSIRSTPGTRTLLKPGVQLGLDRSYRVMTIETTEDTTDQAGAEVLKLKGRSLESIFERRAARPTNQTLTALPTWNITDVPAAVIRKIVTDTCITPTRTYDKISPYIYAGKHPLVPASTITEPVDPIGVQLEPQTVYNAIKNLANTWILGFRLLRDDTMSRLYFDVYTGRDLSMAQMVHPPVVFSPELDNLQNTTELFTIEDAMTSALVITPNGYMEVLAAGIPADTQYTDRAVMIVKADDITLAAGAPLDAAMLQRGKEALSEQRAFQAFDGEINQHSQYVYNVDYSLGDIVEMRNRDGVGNQMRVTEQIFVHDKEGEKAYPTLALNQFVSTGSWLSWGGTRTWLDLDPDPVKWNELP